MAAREGFAQRVTVAGGPVGGGGADNGGDAGYRHPTDGGNASEGQAVRRPLSPGARGCLSSYWP